MKQISENVIVMASHNQHKIKEIEAITKKFGMPVISRDEAGIPPVEIVEDGETEHTVLDVWIARGTEWGERS